MPVTGNEKTPRKKKINHSNSFRNQTGEHFAEAFSREDELRHSTGSMKGHYAISCRFKNDVSLKYPISNQNDERNMNGKRSGSNDSQMSDREEQKKTPSHSVSYLIKGFESKVEYSPESTPQSRPQVTLNDENLTYTDGDPTTSTDKHKRNGSKRKLSIRKRTKASHDAHMSVLQKLGIAPFMGSENRNPKKSLAYFDVQSILFDIDNAAVLKSLYEEGGNRPRNISTGASAASIRGQRKKTPAAEQGNGKITRADSIIDDGDGLSNELVLSCPYFRNETGSVETRENHMNSMNKLLGKYRGDVASRIWTSFGKHRTPSLELIPSTDNDCDTFFGSSVKLNEMDQKREVTIMEPIEANSEIVQWDNPKNSNEKRIFDFEHIDDGALYYREFFVGKDHQNFLGIDEKYGPVSVSMIRENIEKMAVLGHPKENSKNRTNKYQYRIILRTTELRTFRGTVLEESIPSTTRHGSSRALPPRDILEFCFPDLQLSCLRLAIAGPKVPEQLQKIDEQQICPFSHFLEPFPLLLPTPFSPREPGTKKKLSMQHKVGLLYCKSGQNSEEDMYNNEHHGPAFEEFLDVIGERVLLKGFEGYRAQLDNKNDSTGIYSLYSKYHNREVMFHVSTLLPWTPNNKQQLLRKRHIGNDIVTVIFQEPGAEPFTPKNIRSQFQHVFIIVRVENPGTENTTYKVAVSRSQDVPTFGPPIPPNSSFRNNKAFKDFLLSKIINAENAAHKSQKFTAMAVRTRFEYLKDLATNFVSATTIDSGGAKFSKFNPMSLSVKRKEKIHPPCNPEVWCQGGLVWSVKVDLETAATGSLCHMAISTKTIVLIDKTSKEILVSIPCKTVIGWRAVGNSMKLYYNNGQGLNICLNDNDATEMTFVINRLKAVTPGCETQDMSLRRSPGGQLGFHVYYEGLVAEVEPYGMAWQAGLRKGSRLLEINNRFVSKMSHDRMIQALKKPGSIRVVVLPPLPDGQPRNYKSTRNLKRYSSMTSVYSERIHNSSDSSPLSSSRENLTGDFDIVTPIRVSGKGITTVEARIKQSTPYSVSKGNHAPRPQGFILDSDQSLELTEGSSAENPLQSLNLKLNAEKIAATQILRPSKEDMAYSNSLKKGAEKQKKDVLDQRDSGKSLEKFGGKLPLANRSSPSNSSLGSVDPELTELERTITDTRKSIDAKFYKSLVQGSAVRKNLERSNKPRAEYKKSQEELQQLGENAPDAARPRKLSAKHRPSPPSFASLNLNIDKDGAKRVVGNVKTPAANRIEIPDLKLSAEKPTSPDILSNGIRNGPNGYLEGNARKRSEDSQTSSTNSLRRSPPPYEEAISSLDRRRGKQKVVQGVEEKVVYRNPERNLRTSSGTDSNKEDKPKHLASASASERRRYRSLVKSENLEDRIGRKGIIGESATLDNRKCSKDYRGDRLIGAYSESNICTSIERDGRVVNGNIVQTRVRDVNDVINEKNHIRTGSADQLSAFSSLLPRARAGRSSSIDATIHDVGPVVALALPLEDTQKDENNKLPYKETSLGAVATTVEKYSPDDENLTDTFAKIDQAFGFTSYAPSPSPTTTTTTNNKDEKKRKKSKHRQRSKASHIHSESSDDTSTASSLSSSSVRRRNGKPREGKTKPRPVSSDSLKKNKSEAEESLEAAITDFHSTLSNLPDQHSSLDILSSSDTLSSAHTPTPNDMGFSPTNTNEETPKARNSQLRPKNEIRTTVVKRDYTRTPKATVTYTDNIRKISVRSSSRQSSQDSPSHSGKEVGSRVQELVGKFSESYTRKGSLDSSTPVRGTPDRFRSRSEARISLLASPSPWVKREPKQTYLRASESGRDVRRLEKHWSSHLEDNKKELGLHSINGTPVKKKISVSVTPKMSVEMTGDTLTPLPMMPNSPSWTAACERGMLSLPGRGKKTTKEINKDFFDMPLTVRGLDLAPQRAQELEASSKEDLRLMLTVLSGELVKEKYENERLVEELEQAKVEKEQLLEQSQVAASQLRKFTSWFYDSVSQKDSLEEN